MGRHFDELSKSLASGVSRRVSLRRFATGMAGALVTSVLPGRGEPVAAGGVKDRCHDFCNDLDLNRRNRRRCVRKCIRCERNGGDFEQGNGTFFCNP
jgi:hypothetical protein